MRIKISTNPPLPPLKAWFAISDPGSEPTVHTLKRRLCAAIPALRPFSPSVLRLLVDEYELLDECELSVIRDGDLVCIEQVQAQQGNEGPRITKRDETDADRQSKALIAAFDALARKTAILPDTLSSRKRKRREITPSTSSESESSTSSSSSSSGTSASSSDSDSESESESTDLDSDSDSDSESSTSRTTPSLSKGPKYAQVHTRPPFTARVQQTLRKPPSANIPVKAAHFVPPGFGKPQTRARNLRKRIKRKHEREAAPSVEGRASGANATTLARVDNPQEELDAQSMTPDTPADANIATLLSLSLRNKNKAKNFRALMNRPLPPKIIFSDLEKEASTSATPIPQVAESSASAVQRPLPPLVPPSSRPSLPPNLFVTSIDVEAGLRRPKKKQKAAVAEYEESWGHDGYYDHANADAQGEGAMNGDVALDYSDAGGPDPRQDAAPIGSAFDPEALESFANQNWSNLPMITDEQQAIPERVVVYKALGINPTTFSPEYLLTVAKIVALKEDATAKKLVVRPLRPPAQVSFSGPHRGDEEGGDEELEDEEHAWEDVLRDWRIVEQ